MAVLPIGQNNEDMDCEEQPNPDNLGTQAQMTQRVAENALSRKRKREDDSDNIIKRRKESSPKERIQTLIERTTSEYEGAFELLKTCVSEAIRAPEANDIFGYETSEGETILRSLLTMSQLYDTADPRFTIELINYAISSPLRMDALRTLTLYDMSIERDTPLAFAITFGHDDITLAIVAAVIATNDHEFIKEVFEFENSNGETIFHLVLSKGCNNTRLIEMLFFEIISSYGINAQKIFCCTIETDSNDTYTILSETIQLGSMRIVQITINHMKNLNKEEIKALLNFSEEMENTLELAVKSENSGIFNAVFELEKTVRDEGELFEMIVGNPSYCPESNGTLLHTSIFADEPQIFTSLFEFAISSNNFPRIAKTLTTQHEISRNRWFTPILCAPELNNTPILEQMVDIVISHGDVNDITSLFRSSCLMTNQPHPAKQFFAHMITALMERQDLEDDERIDLLIWLSRCIHSNHFVEFINHLPQNAVTQTNEAGVCIAENFFRRTNYEQLIKSLSQNKRQSFSTSPMLTFFRHVQQNYELVFNRNINTQSERPDPPPEIQLHSLLELFDMAVEKEILSFDSEEEMNEKKRNITLFLDTIVARPKKVGLPQNPAEVKIFYDNLSKMLLWCIYYCIPRDGYTPPDEFFYEFLNFADVAEKCATGYLTALLQAYSKLSENQITKEDIDRGGMVNIISKVINQAKKTVLMRVAQAWLRHTNGPLGNQPHYYFAFLKLIGIELNISEATIFRNYLDPLTPQQMPTKELALSVFAKFMNTKTICFKILDILRDPSFSFNMKYECIKHYVPEEYRGREDEYIQQIAFNKDSQIQPIAALNLLTELGILQKRENASV